MGQGVCYVSFLPGNTKVQWIWELSPFITDLIKHTGTVTENTSIGMNRRQEIRECLETGKFSFISQGIFDKNGKLQKIELLARLHGHEGMIPPDIFIPIIDAIGYKTVFDYLVIERAFEDIIRTRPSVPCSINVNPSTFENGAYFLAYIDMLQKQHNVEPTKVILEILETESISDYVEFNKILAELRKRWYRIAVDDFHPVGNHNLFCVDSLHEIDTVKLDGAYMDDLYTRRDEKSVTHELLLTLHSIIDKHPSIDIVVEKIENEEMFEFFRDLFTAFDVGNIHFQGYHFDRGVAF